MEQSTWIYRKKISLINLTAFYSEKTGSVNVVRAEDVICLDLSKAFTQPPTTASQTDEVLATQMDSEVGLKTGYTAEPKWL